MQSDHEMSKAHNISRYNRYAGNSLLERLFGVFACGLDTRWNVNLLAAVNCHSIMPISAVPEPLRATAYMQDISLLIYNRPVKYLILLCLCRSGRSVGAPDREAVYEYFKSKNNI